MHKNYFERGYKDIKVWALSNIWPNKNLQYYDSGYHRLRREMPVLTSNSLFDQIGAKIKRKMGNTRPMILSFVCLAFVSVVKGLYQEPELGSARVVFQTSYGDIEFGFYPIVAPKTVDHIFKLVRLGGYNTNHFFRVDKGFVAQVADVANGRSAPMNDEQRIEAEKKIVGEFSDVKHVRGTLSMGRYDDPDSAQSSFSMLLGDAPHLDRKYAVFGKVTKGDETLSKLEEVPTRREGIFVMPKERITILSTYYYDTKMESCEEERSVLKRRLEASFVEVERQRMKCFP